MKYMNPFYINMKYITEQYKNILALNNKEHIKNKMSLKFYRM
jgi:hypothetical protein